ncbi:FkbM family methyltransferase [Thermoplasma sp. Kam2015]|uniref:FkbM family methyltransferase n=1 Tax=Thermoplasma sp. Kam2015 TaxID=2094122 RepID=UPI00137B3C8F|nr:FkbM family methyltransferase [Thermoplasma sp. Kam2015]
MEPRAIVKSAFYNEEYLMAQKPSLMVILLKKFPIESIPNRSIRYKLNEITDLNLTLKDLILDLFHNERKANNFKRYINVGIDTAKIYFNVDNRSSKFSFKETFFYGQYSYFDYKDKVVIDVGAQTGDSVLYFYMRGARKVIAFEPLPHNFDVLKKNIELNALDCECYDVALGSDDKIMTVNFSGDMVNAFGTGDKINIKMRRLDDYDLSPDLIKIDVEGFEMDVLRGALQTLEKTKEIIIEVHSLELRTEVIELLDSLDFKLIKEDQKPVKGYIANQFWIKK